MNKKALQKLRTARSSLIMGHPFWGCLISHMKPVEALFIPTMVTDGKDLFYNPEFVLATREDHLETIVAHEGDHCARRHHTRMGDRDLERWNIATDHVINNALKAAGFKVPEWAYCDPAYAGLSSEEVYELLPKEPSKPKPQQGQGEGQGQGQQQPGSQGGQQPDKQGKDGKQGQGQGQQQKGQGGGQSQGQFNAPDPGQMGGILPAVPQWDKPAMAEEDARWEIITRQAINVAKAQNAGQVPGYLKRLVQDLERPRIDWLTQLRQFVDDSIYTEYAWTNPNRRFLHSGLVLPGRVPDRINHIVDVMDTSGSVNDKLIAKMAAEKKAFMDEGVCDKLTVIYADTKVHNVQTFERGDEIVLDPKGGGGTNFRKVFEYIKENCDDASVILFFTDLITMDFGDDPNRPVLWVVYGRSDRYEQLAKTVPFGECIYASV